MVHSFELPDRPFSFSVLFGIPYQAASALRIFKKELPRSLSAIWMRYTESLTEIVPGFYLVVPGLRLRMHPGEFLCYGDSTDPNSVHGNFRACRSTFGMHICLVFNTYPCRVRRITVQCVGHSLSLQASLHITLKLIRHA